MQLDVLRSEFPEQLPTIHVDSIKRDQFIERYVLKKQPVVIEGIPEAQNWRATKRWASEETFLGHYGDVPLRIGKVFPEEPGVPPFQIRIPVKGYREYLQGEYSDAPFYVFEDDFEGERSQFLTDYSVPSFFEEDLYDLNEKTRSFYPFNRHILIGGTRTGTNIHIDPKYTAAWNTLLCGKKKWMIFPEHASFTLQNGLKIESYEDYCKFLGTKEYRDLPPSYWWIDIPPKLSSPFGYYEFIQEPGQTIYIPAGCWHAVLNLSFTISITHNLLHPKTFPSLQTSMQQKYPKFTKYLTSLLTGNETQLEEEDENSSGEY
uniref:JmjC domain-containing protein n=1 Tax=Arcella intermedia TaxID=1963864 RepID=A0A6B2LA12_9EUKA